MATIVDGPTLAEREGLGLTLDEIVTLGAVKPDFYSSFFFPKTARQATPEFHLEMWRDLMDEEARFVSFEVFRDGAKTSVLRLFMSHCIAYARAHTILLVGKGQDSAIKSLQWMQNRMESNHIWRETYGLSKGKIWNSTDCEIYHKTEEYPIRVLTFGMTGQIRGVNIDDFRPDLIILDDPCDEENTATPEQREKMSNLFYGALANTLAPKSESPHAKMALLQTPLHKEDLISQCRADPEFRHRTYSCFTDGGSSRWGQRYPTEVLLAQKAAAAARNKLHIWNREKECKLTSPETSSFRAEWLKFWEIVPEFMQVYMAIDPTPPPKDGDPGNIKPRHDYCALVVIGVVKGHVFLLEYYVAKGKNPMEISVEFFRLYLKWHPIQVGVESVNYQRVLAWFLREEMLRRQIFVHIIEIQDKRRKSDRINQAINGRASNGTIHVHRSHTEFIEQYTDYPDVSHVDLLDAFTIALDLINPHLQGLSIEGEYERIEAEEKDIPDLDYERSAP